MHPYQRQNSYKTLSFNTKLKKKKNKEHKRKMKDTWSKSGGRIRTSSLKRGIFSYTVYNLCFFDVLDANVALRVVFPLHLVQLPQEEEEEAVWNE